MKALTPALIETDLVEGQACDFKSRLDLGEAKAKADLADDVVAFLNRGEGRILIGVEERGGRFAQYRPLTGDADALTLRVQSMLQDTIVPEPLNLVVEALPVGGGFVLDIRIPAHGLRPYQNRLTGAFQIRTGAKNRALGRDQIEAMFEAGRRQEQALLDLIGQAETQLRQQGAMQDNGPSLTISILPQAHHDRGRAPFDRGHGLIKGGPLFHDGRSAVFQGCEGGHEAVSQDFAGKWVERLFVGDTWFVHAHIVHPFDIDHERLKLPEFKDALADYLQALQAFLDAEAVEGPHWLMIAINDLHRSDRMARLFPKARTVALPRPVWIERIDTAKLAEQMFNLARRSSIYG